MSEATNQQWANRIVAYGEESPAALLANPRNIRLHPQDQADALAAILRKVGYVQDVIVNKNTGFLVDGHLRVQLALQQAQLSIPVKYVELTEEEETEMLLFLDYLTTLATVDTVKMSKLVEEVRTLAPVVQAALARRLEEVGFYDTMPAFTPASVDEQGRLDQKQGIRCPECGHVFQR